jgi:hypothetical protein
MSSLRRPYWLALPAVAVAAVVTLVVLLDPGDTLESEAASRGRDAAAALPPPTPVLHESVAIVIPESEEGVFPLPGSDVLESRLHSQTGTAGQDVEILQEMLALYREANGGALPIAPDNAVLMSQLRGRNGRRVAVISSSNRNLNASGELLDRWGTAYFFHPVSSAVMEIRSAGPDKVMWTEDDVQLPSPESDNT